MTKIARPMLSNKWLADMAAAEVAARDRTYPKQIETGAIDRDAAVADADAWRAIAALLREGSVETELRWADLLRATSNNLIRRRDALARAERAPAPADQLQRLRERETAAQSIHDRIVWHHWYHCGGPAAAPKLPAEPVLRPIARAA